MVKYMKNKKIIIPVAIIAAVILAGFIITITILDIYSSDVLTESGTPWSSDDPEIYINEDLSGTIKFEDKTINISCKAEYNTIDFIDADKEKNSSAEEAVIFSGECIRNVSGDKLSVKVIESNIDQVKVEDEFVLCRKD